MKIFRCDGCGHPVFFENVQCLHCGCALAFLPDELAVAAVEPVPNNGGGLLWQRIRDAGSARQYRPCHNSTEYQACNFAVLADDPSALCVSCRQTRLLPDLSVPANRERWYLIEVAKRRLHYSLAKLGLVSIASPSGQLDGPIFEFLADLPGSPAVLTGHRDGVITLNVAEADDDERTRRRLALNEPYRTLLGHMRHESGHYYWDKLILSQGRTGEFRALFGDHSLDYTQALHVHYSAGPGNTQWQDAYVSAYATAHPWEDWAETWAHYLHMVDLLETAASYSTRVVVPGSEGPPCEHVSNPFETGNDDFDHLVEQWVPVTLLLNSLNRSLGQNDAYPFVLTTGALRKLRYVHDVIHASAPLAK